MIKINYSKWKDTIDDLRTLSLSSEHRRSRERYLAIYEIATGKTATQVALELKRRLNTVSNWAQSYNEKGAESLIYKKSGGRLPLFRQQ